MSGALDIVGIGMVTAVGLDAPSACAAMRARLDGFCETGFVADEKGWLIGAPVPLPRPFIGERRLAQMAAAAITEAFEAAPEARGQAVLILCLAEEDRPGRPQRDDISLLRRIAEIVEVKPLAHSRIVAHGRPSGHVALNIARRILASGDAPFVMIAGVDSYLTHRTIGHFLAEDRLLTTDNPNGFLPGEAAGAVLCCRPAQGSMRLHGLGLARESASIYNHEDLPLRGDGMTSAYAGALGEIGIEMGQVGYRIADLIGEQYWFKQSTLALVRTTKSRREFIDLWSPAESLGNVGAAVVPIMIGMACTAAAKGYAAGNSVLIEASNDHGACGAAVLAPAF